MFETFTKNFTKYVCQNDSENLSNLFTKDGCYHDYISGNFKGRKNISTMLSDYFHRDGKDFFWEMYDHSLENNLGYVKYRFSFISKIPDYKGRKVVIPGIGCGILKEFIAFCLASFVVFLLAHISSFRFRIVLFLMTVTR